MKTVRDVSEAFRKSGKLRIDLTSSGVEGIQVGNRWFSRKETDGFFEKKYHVSPTNNPSSYLDFINTVAKSEAQSKDNYKKNRYVV